MGSEMCIRDSLPDGGAPYAIETFPSLERLSRPPPFPPELWLIGTLCGGLPPSPTHCKGVLWYRTLWRLCGISLWKKIGRTPLTGQSKHRSTTTVQSTSHPLHGGKHVKPQPEGTKLMAFARLYSHWPPHGIALLSLIHI